MRMNHPNPFTLAYITQSSARHGKLCRGDRLIPTISRLASDVFLSLELHPTPKPRNGPNLDVVVRKRQHVLGVGILDKDLLN